MTTNGVETPTAQLKCESSYPALEGGNKQVAMAMWLKKQLNADVCEHINKISMKIHNEEIERKKQEDLEDLTEILEDFQEQLQENYTEDYEHIYLCYLDEWNDSGERRRLMYEVFLEYCNSHDAEWIVEGRMKILMDTMFDNLDEFWNIIERFFPIAYDLPEDCEWYDEDYETEDYDWENDGLEGMWEWIQDIMVEYKYLKFTKKCIWKNPLNEQGESLLHLTQRDIYAVDKRCKAWKRGKVQCTGHATVDFEKIGKQCDKLWDRQDKEAILKILKKWMKTTYREE